MGLKFFKLLKAHVEKMPDFRLSTMLMKKNELNRYLHDVDEKKGERRWMEIMNYEGGIIEPADPLPFGSLLPAHAEVGVDARRAMGHILRCRMERTLLSRQKSDGHD